MPRSSSMSEARSPPLPPHTGPGYSPYLGPSVSSFAYAHPPPLGIFEPTGPSAAITDRSPNPSPMLMPTKVGHGTAGAIAPLPARAIKLPPAAMYSSANGSRSTLASSSGSPPSGAFASTSAGPSSSVHAGLLPPPAVAPNKQSASQTASTATTSAKRSSASARDSKRRATHSQIERRRREKINDRLITLRNLVPACAREVEERRRVKAEEEESARRVAQGLPPLSPTAGPSDASAADAANAGAGTASDKAKRKRSRRRAAAAAAAAAVAEASGGADTEDKEEDLGLHKLEVLTHAIDYIYELQARIAILESQLGRSSSLGGSHYASSIRSASTTLTSPVMSLHADSPIMAGFARPPSGSLPMAAKTTAVTPLFESFTVSSSSSSRSRPALPHPRADSWRDVNRVDGDAEQDGDVSPVSLYGRIPSLSASQASMPSMLLPPPAEGSQAPSSEASAAAAEALLSISVSPDTLRPVSNVRDAPLPLAGTATSRRHPYARRTTLSGSEPQGSAASTFHHLQQDRAAAAAAAAGAKAAKRQSRTQTSVSTHSTAEDDDDVNMTPVATHGASVDTDMDVEVEQTLSGASQEIDIGDDTDPLSESHVDENGRLITPPALELGDSATQHAT